MSEWTRKLNSEKVRGIFWQIVVVGGTIALGAFLVSNTLTNLEKRGIATGFDFLSREAGFGISETLIPYTAAGTYLKALTVGVLNTLKVALLGIALATVIGVIVGIARLSRNWLVARLASVYVESVRNIPLLLQLFIWYAVMTGLPTPRQGLSPIEGIYLSNRGLKVPSPIWSEAHWWAAGGLAIAIAATIVLVRWARKRHAETGHPFPTISTGTALILALPTLCFVAAGGVFAFDVPRLEGFNFQGGWTLTPEFAALLAGLTVYTAAFIAEVVRSGILAVPHGQAEAALALGLKRGLVLRLVILPQAMRVIVPPVTSQYLNLTKNSSLAVAIGFPDIVSVANTSANQTGQAIEAVALIMAVFLTISLGITGFMNWYNQKVALVTR